MASSTPDLHNVSKQFWALFNWVLLGDEFDRRQSPLQSQVISAPRSLRSSMVMAAQRIPLAFRMFERFLARVGGNQTTVIKIANKMKRASIASLRNPALRGARCVCCNGGPSEASEPTSIPQ